MRKNAKKLIVLLVLLMALVACGGKPADKQGDALVEAINAGGKLTFVLYNTEQKEVDDARRFVVDEEDVFVVSADEIKEMEQEKKEAIMVPIILAQKDLPLDAAIIKMDKGEVEDYIVIEGKDYKKVMEVNK